MNIRANLLALFCSKRCANLEFVTSAATNQTDYDSVLYPSYTHPQTHPNRLAVIGTLGGLSPAAPARCRLLELGCGDGSNLIPMAWTLPESEFAGIDLAAVPIARGNEMAAALNLRNIQLRQGDVLRSDGGLGTFDYIIAHGLYSWVPVEVREALLALCRKLLRPHGIAFVSYNALPGGHVRTMIREMMLFHVRGFDSADERVRQARALAQFVSQGQNSSDEYRLWMKAELQRVLEHEPGYLYHDHLADINQAFYFTQFVEQAAAHGLQFLAEADYFEMSAHSFAGDVRETLEQLGANRIVREQYLDFLKCRRFRQTLLCHCERTLQPPRPEQVMAFHVTCPARSSETPVDLAPRVSCAFQAPNGARCETDFALGKAALAALIPIFPSSLAFAETLDRAIGLLSKGALAEAIPNDRKEREQQLAGFLLQVYTAGLVDFRYSVTGVSARVSERPTASALARWQLERRNLVTSHYHLPVQIEDEVGRNLLSWLDGTLDRAGLFERLWEFMKSKNALKPELSEAEARRDLETQLEQNLQKLARVGLLVS
jgi:SAM-dependent methyltransferase